MSTLEERRAERRRRRQMEEEASSVATVNGEDDLERRRRERREARLRESEATTDDYSSRRNRRRGTDDDISEDSNSYSSYRSRRERNWDTEDSPVVNDTSRVPDTSEADAAEERRRRQREEEEEEARRQAEREEEEERERQAALEEERRREQRQREEQRRQEEERRREEEEERQREEETDSESGSARSPEQVYDQNAQKNKLFIEEDDLVAKDSVVDKLEYVRKWNEESEKSRAVFENKKLDSEIKDSPVLDNRGSNVLREVNNNKVKDKLNKFEHIKDESDNQKSREKRVIIPTEKEGLKGRVKLFEKEIREQEVAKTEGASVQTSKSKRELQIPQPQKLTEKLQHFEIAAKSQTATTPSTRNVQYELEQIGSSKGQRQALLGRWSSSETHINKTDSKETPKKLVLDRWKSVEKQTQDIEPAVKSPETKPNLQARLSGNTGFIAAKYIQKTKSIDEILTPSPKPPTPSLKHNSLPRTGSRTEQNDNIGVTSDDRTRSKVTDRWNFKETDVSMGVKKGSMSNGNVSHSHDSSSDVTSSVHSRGSSLDGSSDRPSRISTSNTEEEEAEARRKEEEAKAQKMAEESKKRGKRKGLGGLTPEKKKKLKELIGEVRYTNEEEAEKIEILSERVQSLPDDLDRMSPDELRKLIKTLHDKLAQIHSEAYDVEFKLNKQDKEIVDLNMKISDSKGKFAKPVLRKVNKTEQKFEAITKKQDNPSSDFRETLKSTHEDEERESGLTLE